jgi:prepilin-type N-terminal cleavage/methylation domain-containing protein
MKLGASARFGGRRAVGDRRAFTLIEIMVVVGIAALVMATSVPLIHQVLHKDVLRQGISDVVEACHHARAAAILSAAPAELRILPQQRTFQVALSADRSRSVPAYSDETDGGGSQARPASVPAASAKFKATLDARILVEELAVNFLPMMDVPEARVRFHPNGTSDEFTVVLRFEGQALRKISLDPITGGAQVRVLEGTVWK